MMSPVLTTVAARLKGRVQVVKIDTDKYPGIASQYRVQVRRTGHGRRGPLRLRSKHTRSNPLTTW